MVDEDDVCLLTGLAKAFHGCSIRRARLQHDHPSDHDNQIPPSHAWALYNKPCFRHV